MTALRKILLGVAIVAAIAGTAGFKYWRENLRVVLPDYPAAERTVWLQQGWSAQQRDWFHHEDQRTQTFGIPLEWLTALEQPSISLYDTGALSDPAYLDGYGFIPDPARTTSDSLPIGFAWGETMLLPGGRPWLNPRTKAPMTAVGLTCAACHTGRLMINGTEVLIDGAPALTNLDKFRTGVALSLLYTRKVPFRFGRFADRVLGPDADDAARSALRGQLDDAFKTVELIHGLDDKVAADHVDEGFARLDALNRIGNTVFALDTDVTENYRATSAPVHYPRIWDASWFTWVQYNASIEQPMVRNAGEAMGVGAWVNLQAAGPALFASSIAVRKIGAMETLLAGVQPTAKGGFSGLTSPRWGDPALHGLLNPTNPKLVAAGAALYADRCQGCHLAPVGTATFWADRRWKTPEQTRGVYLDLDVTELAKIGTDPAQAEDMAARTVMLRPELGIKETSFGPALGSVVDRVVSHWYDTHPVPSAEREELNGNRPNGIAAPLGYKARPLNGIWATPPYLHNGSVPTLYALLSPVAERPKQFTLGRREYDQDDVGYATDPLAGGSVIDTSARGNHNTGHEFSDTQGRGVIGPALSPAQRRALVEYLKTL